MSDPGGKVRESDLWRAQERAKHTCLSHVHELDGVLFVVYFVRGEVHVAEPALADFLVHFVIVENRAVIEGLP